MGMNKEVTPGLVEVGEADLRLSLGELASIFVARWKLVLACVVGSAALALGISLMITPTYRSTVLIAPSVRDSAGAGGLSGIIGQIGSLSGLVGELGLGVTATRKDVWIGTLKSRELARLLIERDGMTTELFHSRWDPDTQSWKPGFFNSAAPTSDDAVQLLLEKVLNIVEDKRTGLVTVSVDWRNADLAARWANDLVALANAEIRAGLIDENQRSIAFLEKDLSKTAVIERRQIIYRLIESRINESMLINARTDYAFTVIDPATPSAKNRYVRPNRLRYIVTGTLVGMLAAAMFVLASISRPQKLRA